MAMRQSSEKRVQHVVKPLRKMVEKQAEHQKAEVRDLYDAQVNLNLLYSKVSERYDDMFRVILKEFSDLFLHFKAHRDTLERIHHFLMDGGVKHSHAYKFLIDEKMEHERHMQESINNIDHALYLLKKEKEMRPIVEQVRHYLQSLFEKIKIEIGSDEQIFRKGLNAQKEIMDLRVMLARDSAPYSH